MNTNMSTNMSTKEQFPSYERLFERLDFKKGDEARSVYSPGAYLADLLQLLHDKFETTNLTESGIAATRRPDIEQLPLNAENTFGELPYLDIVNELLENVVGDDPYRQLREASYPLQLPFNLQNERIKRHCHHLAISAEQLHKTFATQPNSDVVAREYLGLSEEEYQVIVTAVNDPAQIRASYGLGANATWASITPVEEFLKKTKLTGGELRALLFQNLSHTAQDPQQKSEITQAELFFINHGLGGCVTLDEKEENLNCTAPSEYFEESIKDAWFERVNRFVRLANKTALSFADLDLILRSCCNNQLDAAALRTLAVIKQLRDERGIPIDVLCSFFGPVTTLGIGDEPAPLDLFNRVFNGRSAEIDQSYIAVSVFKPRPFSNYAPLTCTGDLLAANNKAYRRRVSSALAMSERDIAAIVARFRTQYAARKEAGVLALDREVDLNALSVLHRISKLSEALDITYTELFGVLDLLEKDPSIRQHTNFNVLVEERIDTVDCYRILENQDVRASLWLVQTLFAVVKWMQASDFTSQELNQILSGRVATAASSVRLHNEKLSALDSLYQQIKPVMLTTESFVSPRFNERTSRVIHRVLTEKERDLVSRQDSRLVRYDEGRAMSAAYQAIAQLGVIRKEDFMALGLETRLVDKIYSNLIIHGLIDDDGQLQESRLPTSVSAFRMATDFGAHRDAVFAIVNGLYAASNDDASGQDDVRNDDTALADVSLAPPDWESIVVRNLAAIDTDALVDVSLFPSDLDSLTTLSELEKSELYDNLVFNGYLSSEGNVIAREFFLLPENVVDFRVNAELAGAAAGVYAELTRRIQRFDTEPLTLDPAIFADLALTPSASAALIANLKFNGYIDANNRFVDKRGLLRLSIDKFELSLEFYTRRREILAAVNTQIESFKANVFHIEPMALQPVADVAVAQRVFESLATDYLKNNRVSKAHLNFFRNRDKSIHFSLGTAFSATDHELVFNQVATILAERQRYQLPLDLAQAFYFDEYEYAELLQLLGSMGCIGHDLGIAENKLSYFLNINHALDFSLVNFEDYSKDVFFVLHAMATETEAAMREIAATLQAQRSAQEDVVYNALQDAFGVDVELIKVLCRHVFNGTDQVVAAFILPLLPVVDVNDSVASEPADKKFNTLYLQMAQFALLASKLGLSAVEADIVLRDQNLVEKFPEKLRLPEGVTSFDTLLESTDGVIYVFKGELFWAYSAVTCELLHEQPRPLRELSDRLVDVEKIDGAFVDQLGTSYLIAGRSIFSKAKTSSEWIKKERTWGKVKNNFDNPKRIDTAFQDHDGKTYLFAGDQYIRYSEANYGAVDEGYPRAIAGNWESEGRNTLLPAAFKGSIDASFQGTDGQTYLFKQTQYVCSDKLGIEKDINETWGKVKNNFAAVQRIDASYTDGADTYLFAGNQVISYRDSIENEHVKVNEGYPKRIESHFANLPAEFEMGLEAAFKGVDGKIHLFKNGKTVSMTEGVSATPVAIKKIWGRVANKIQETGQVDAAFVGLDGKTYLFSGNQYVRYSGTDYAQVDEGYPRVIGGDWGGLRSVDAAFALDGKTYLFGKNDKEEIVYVRYSTRDYRVLDAGYPKQPNDNWWNLPAKLMREDSAFNDLEKIDAVFTGKDDITYLFSGKQFISFDNKQRWWSEPQNIESVWNGIPLKERVDAAFVGTDGKTYVFSGKRYVRYSNSTYSKVDDRYPIDIKAYWGNVVNNIEKTGTVDAALTVESWELIGNVKTTVTHTYLFSGNQYVRYRGSDYKWVENGYPRYIAGSLKAEPRFKNLLAGCERGIDAAFADQRNVYLFKDAQCQVLSEATYRVYENIGFTRPSCALIEHGALYIEENNNWQRYSALEGTSVGKYAGSPALLRNVPEAFKTGLDAVLQGVDRNTYLFKGADCFNVSAHKSYPLAEEWGRAKNDIYTRNTIDAVFVGTDNKTYVFSGDQFVVYSGATYEGVAMEGYPKSISGSFGGLTNVVLAYVKNGTTFVCEKADADGRFRYVRYSTSDYTQPDENFPQTAERDFWKIPEKYHDQGFTQVNAVLFDGDTMFLLSHDQYLQFDAATRAWSYPRPIDRLWRNFPWHEHDFAAVKTAFKGADGTTYFFADKMYLRYTPNGFSAPLSIKENWGLAHNNFAGQFGQSKVDAVFVYRNTTTYLFSGDQYVRYSGEDYRFADAGYPKPLLDNLRKEPCFQNLPEAFESVLRERVAQNAATPITAVDPLTLIDAVVANDRNIYILVASRCFVVSQQLAATYDLNIIGQVKNNIVDFNRVDACFVGAQNDNATAPTFLFSGDQYVRYSTNDYSYVDDGYPRSIGETFAAEMGAAPLPARFNEGIDAALHGADGSIYLFKDAHYINLAEGAEREIRGKWGVVNNAFNTLPQIDAAFVAANGNLYVFKDRQFIRYQNIEQEFVDEAYPKSIQDQWGNLPADFEAGIDGAFVFDDKTYFVKGENYVRYSDLNYARIDSLYPQAFSYRWGNWADYFLSDVKIIARFKELQDAHASSDGGLAECLDIHSGNINAPYERLATLFGWDVDELKWLKRHNGFLPTPMSTEIHFQLELIVKLADIFATAQRVGAKPSDLWNQVWRKLYDEAQAPNGAPRSLDVRAAADALLRYLVLAHSEKDGQVLVAQIHGELNELKRDALTALVIARDVALDDASDLYERYLIDVNMANGGTTSRVQEAIAAVQLYFHRYFFNLEAPATKAAGSEWTTKQELKGWWKWMRNYRLWEANRKVFLYPENYIRPELRDTKTPAFKTLEEDLLQGDITEATVQQAYKKYLDEYTEVSRLTIAGGYVFPSAIDDTDGSRVVLFGRTKTDPRRYYYREAQLNKENADDWGPWLYVNVQIDADTVYPVHAFGRVFVFWSKVETVAETNASTTLTTTARDANGNQTVSSGKNQSYALRVYYSFYNLNKEWVAPQALNIDIKEAVPISAVNLLVRNSKTLRTDTTKIDHDNILIACNYRAGTDVRVKGANLTPELYASSTTVTNFANRGDIVLVGMLNEPWLTAMVVQAEMLRAVVGPALALNSVFARATNWGQDPSHVVMLGGVEYSTTGYWFAFDYKGGSFLCKPDIEALDKNAWPNDRAKAQAMPQKAVISAAVSQRTVEPANKMATDDKRAYYFSDTQFASADYRSEAAWQPTAEYWGRKRNNLAVTGRVDAALVRNGKVFLFSGNEYMIYSDASGFADPESPKPLARFASSEFKAEFGNNLPADWTRVDAVFTAPGTNTTYFFNSEKKAFVVATGSKFSEPQSVIGKWGKNATGQATAFAANGVVDGAWVSGELTYLFSGDQYIRYKGSDYAAIEPGYPKAISSNSENLPKKHNIGAAFTHPNGKTYFFSAEDNKYVEAGDLTREMNCETGWGRVSNAFTRTGRVDTAYWQGNALYLISGTDLIRYTFNNGTLPDDFTKVSLYVDEGYPKTIAFEPGKGLTRIDAGFTLKKDGPRYFLAGGYYFALPTNQEPTQLNGSHAIAGSWVGFPDELEAGIDGALERQGELIFFKAMQYAAFPRNSVAKPDDQTLDPWSVTGLYEIAEAKYDIVRLSSSTAYKLNETLFEQGVPGLLALPTQKMPELPKFSETISDATTIRVGPRVANFPHSDSLDFSSANGLYYWEIFFHVPYLIAQALNTGQKFEEAKQWYEFVFDPIAKAGANAGDNCWQFLPFRPESKETASNEKLVDSAQSITQIKTYLDDPFDPHAIAALRTTAYRKAIVMAYVDNVLDWGDMLFRQYTRESINEARMLYILAYDLLGEKPESLGRKVLAVDRSFAELPNPTAEYDILLSIDNPYFFVPENAEFGEYWTRVQDRLSKIRHSLNILGISQPLPLFEPPIDPMALVQAAGTGAALSSVMASLNVAVPHYRFKFMLRKAQELLQTVNGFGNDLLAALEKKDAENLSQLQNRQESEILKLTRAIKEAQISVAVETVKELEGSVQSAQDRAKHYGRLINEGMLPTEEAQIGLMAAGAASHFASAGLKIGAAVATGVPEVLMGPFIIGTSVGGQEIGGALSEVAGVAEGLGEGLSMAGEVLGVVAQFQRSTEDWSLQLNTAQHDIVQIGHQLSGARLQEQVARRELEIHDKQVAHNAAITTFMQTKFSNAQLYQWMVSKLAGLYYQSFSMAYDMAKAAEKAFQFERAIKAGEVSYIQPIYWESQKQGLLAGVSLALDLTRLEKAYIDNDRRGFEITKKISLLALDPVALLQLKTKGVCEFALTEALFDYDFPGHYCRQIRTVALTFTAGDQRLQVNATLTQLNHKTVLEPDAKAVKHLIDPKNQPPLTLRSDWRSSQQIALSHVEDNEANNGLFELRYDDERYLPFEGTGAVSTWRLELNGKKGAYNVDDLQDVIVTLKYSADQGGEVFATAVKGMLKPYTTARLLDVAREFPDAWETFQTDADADLVLTLTREQFPQMHGSRLAGVYTRYELQEPGAVSMVLNDNTDLTLKDGKYLATPGLTVGRYGSEWALRVQGAKAKLANVGLVVMYTAKVG